MKVVSGKAFARLPEQRGCTLQRMKGSHHIYGKQGHTERISVPIHANSPLKIGLQRHLILSPVAAKRRPVGPQARPVGALAPSSNWRTRVR